MVVALLTTTMSASAAAPITLDGFSDAVHHWYNRTGQADAPLHKPVDVKAIADNIVLYQRNNGGWPENKHPQRLLSDVEKARIVANKPNNDASFDNRNIYPQITYLAHAYQITGDERYRRAAIAGLTFTLDIQYANGGWPHSPGREDRSYAEHITFADEVMPGVLGFLRQVASAAPPFEFVPKDLRERARGAVNRGDQLILDLQIVIDGKPTIWAGQYDKNTLVPVAARSYELPALQTWESVAVVDYLMSKSQPSARVISAVDAAVDWFVDHRIEGLRVEEVAINPVRFEYHTATFDRKLVQDSTALGLWARFYDIKTRQPFFTNRDGSRVESLAEVHLERRSGYHWYGTWPEGLLSEDYPRWRASHNARSSYAGELTEPK
ncbi:pectate lyase [Gilvimarinus sp. SDUM040013]|uniref:pectate lyase n=1 Tax=Gilvimarinus gilvus TaxID=3058038 RepID=UPI0026728202|nr:pectate lyase [Gilvimarinus sp. SDUM040013]MDO3387250.1 pectate lyase [Gilvimarinus sp. SDUM040013]